MVFKNGAAEQQSVNDAAYHPLYRAFTWLYLHAYSKV